MKHEHFPFGHFSPVFSILLFPHSGFSGRRDPGRREREGGDVPLYLTELGRIG